MARPALVAALLFAAACGTAPRREYYAPMGGPAGPRLEAQVAAERSWRVETRCQGSYLNLVAGRPVRTLHLQLDLMRTSPRPMAVRLEDLVLEVLDPGAGPPRPVPLAEAWSGDLPVTGELVIEPWSRAPLDLFFDEPGPPGDAPAALRFRWRHAEPSAWQHHESLFARVAWDDPRRPSDRLPHDRAYGYRDGWYMPGLGDLGARALQPTVEQRSHYVFHSP